MRTVRSMLRFALPLLLALGLSSPAHAQVIEGTARVIDGDTLDMTGTRIRLAYIDAPESKQSCMKDNEKWACGADATASLASLVDGQAISCAIIETDIYGREVATCQSGIFNIGQEMIRRGMAVAFDTAPDHYLASKRIAQNAKTGIWSSTFELPSVWRKANRQAPLVIARAEPGLSTDPNSIELEPRNERVFRSGSRCLIKGNRSRRGEWIYHLPGRPYYNATRAEEVFCTESEARAAGYRKSRA